MIHEKIGFGNVLQTLWDMGCNTKELIVYFNQACLQVETESILEPTELW